MARGIDPTVATTEPVDQSRCYCGPAGEATQAEIVEQVGVRSKMRCPDCGHEWIGYSSADVAALKEQR